MTRRLVDAYAAATDDDRAAGAAWYRRAERAAADIGRRHGLPAAQAAGIIAALSPRMRWAANVRAAEAIAAAIAAGRRAPRVGLAGNVRKAERIARGEPAGAVLSGPKVRAFWRNITGDHAAVTVDVWAARAATGQWRAPLPEKGRYGRYAAAYVAAAARVGVPPRELQAAVWVHTRGSAD